MRTLCIYHAECPDGFGAAYIVTKSLGEENVELYEGVYGQPPPDVSNREVYIVDFSYSRQQLQEMCEQATSVVLLDHHKTAIEQLEGFTHRNLTMVLDNDQSGAMLTAKYFLQEENIPPLVHHIQDRDLWRFELEDTAEVMATVFSFPYTIKAWNKLFNMDRDRLVAEGVPLLRDKRLKVRQCIDSHAYQSEILSYIVPMCNVPYFMASDTAHVLAKGWPFAATYYMDEDTVHFSLRSRRNGIDVERVARVFGGGGHKHAAGFKLQRNSLHLLTQKNLMP